MTIGGIFIIERGLVPRRMQKQMNAILKETWRSVGVLWHEEMRPKHFTHAGAREYQYTRRSGQDASRSSKWFRQSYTGRKYRRFGHTLPLVYTGEVRSNTKQQDVRPTGKGVRIVLRGANKLNYVPRGGTINMREEMLRVSSREEQQITAHINRAVKKGIKELDGTVTRRRIA